uniref:MFS transporter n=1 Tax=uncultured Sphingomonas sp. TaxID=158754 RepID=UPI0035CC70C3
MNTTRDALVTRRIRKARIATFIGFAAIGALMYIWSTGVSALRDQIGLSGATGDVRFGLLALAIGLGAAIGSFGVGYFLDAIGPRRVITVGAIAYPIVIVMLGYAGSYTTALVLGVVLGLLRGGLDTALNTHGVQVERFYGRSIMSAFHAFYSIGGFAFGLIASWLATMSTTSPAIPFTVLGGLLAVVGIATSPWLLSKGEVPDSTPETANADAAVAPSGSSDFAVVLLMIGFGLLLLGSMIGENAIADWGQEFVRRATGSPLSTAGLAVSVFIGAEAVGRLAGDRAAEVFGREKVVFGSGLVSVIGLAIVIAGGTVAAAIVGFGLFGLGLSSIAPLMLSSAGRKDPAHAGRNIGIVNSIGYLGMLVGPALITVIVGQFGLSKLLYLPIGLLILLTVFGPLLMRDRRLSEHDANQGRT